MPGTASATIDDTTVSGAEAALEKTGAATVGPEAAQGALDVGASATIDDTTVSGAEAALVENTGAATVGPEAAQGALDVGASAAIDDTTVSGAEAALVENTGAATVGPEAAQGALDVGAAVSAFPAAFAATVSRTFAKCDLGTGPRLVGLALQLLPPRRRLGDATLTVSGGRHTSFIKHSSGASLSKTSNTGSLMSRYLVLSHKAITAELSYATPPAKRRCMQMRDAGIQLSRWWRMKSTTCWAACSNVHLLGFSASEAVTIVGICRNSQ